MILLKRIEEFLFVASGIKSKKDQFELSLKLLMKSMLIKKSRQPFDGIFVAVGGGIEPPRGS
jgi:hypothetical protein